MRCREAVSCAVIIGALMMLVGCRATIDNGAVRKDDTEARWQHRLAQAPYVIHSDGRSAAFAASGMRWPESSELASKQADRVEIYLNATMDHTHPDCATSSTPDASPRMTRTSVVVVLCDAHRRVVAATDHPPPGTAVESPAYFARLRHLLMTGIWSSVAQEPPPVYDRFNDE